MKHTLRSVLALALMAAMLFSSQAFAAYETLEYGSRGPEVLKLQQTLLQLGFDPNGADGKFGRGTEKAVKNYQYSRGLTADGKAGNKTLTKLYAEAGNASSSGSSSSGSSSSAGSGSVTATNPNTLKYGDSGSRVTELQQNLKKLGYYSSSIDGKFGAGTQRAVVAFQKANGLTADGLAGSKTLELIAQKASGSTSSGSTSSGTTSSGSSSSGSASSSTSTYTRTLRQGYTGEDVKSVQTRLKALGYYDKTIDGVYGTGSIAAVKAFQKKNGLTADGLAGKKTFDRLFSSSAIANGSSSSSSSDSSTSTGYETLRPGATGTEVKKMQQALRNLNYLLSADGSYGGETVEAVKEFQRLNGLTADGVAGSKTLKVLYSGNAVKYSSSSSGSSGSSGTVSSSAGASAMGTFTGRNGQTIRLLHWQNEIKPNLRTGAKMTVYEPSSGISFTLYVMSRGRHADVEPLTADDTAKMMEAWGGKESWTPKTVYVGLPDGRWSMAVMHNVAHGSQTISGNNYDGQNCVHFLRDMSECEANDPDYGVTNQNALRKAWKAATGVLVE